jgi:hypothetical protein
MITIIILILLCIGIFFISFIAPRKGSGIQRYAGRLLKKLNRKPKAAQIILGPPSVLSHKTVHKSAHMGKRARKKVSRKTRN